MLRPCLRLWVPKHTVKYINTEKLA